jgi:hypothetical protein
MSATPRLSLPFLAVGQAQKEFTHNESLQTLDALVSGAVEEPPRAAPPATPALGSCFIVDAAASGAWAGMSGSVAVWSSGGWRFIAPLDGMSLFERSSGTWMLYRNGAWEAGVVRGASLVIDGEQVVGSRLAAIATPAGGSVIDLEARASIAAMLDALRQHGLIEA